MKKFETFIDCEDKNMSSESVLRLCTESELQSIQKHHRFLRDIDFRTFQR